MTARRPDPEEPLSHERREALANLFAKHGDELSETLSRNLGGDKELAKEAMSATWLRLVTRHDVDLAPGQGAPGWLYVAGQREAWKIRARDSRTVSLDQMAGERAEDTSADMTPGLDDTEEFVEDRERLAQIKELAPINQHALTANAMGLSYEEIAAQAGITPSAAKGRVITARRQARALDAHRQHGDPEQPRPTFNYDKTRFVPMAADAPEISQRQLRIAARRELERRDGPDLGPTR